MRKIRKKIRMLDLWLFLPYIILCGIGIVMVYSASAAIRMQTGGSPTAYLIKQAIYVIMGLIITLFIYNMNIEKLRYPKLVKYGCWGIIGLLVLVRLIGQAVNGARGWLDLGFFSIQPAEVAKFYLIIYLAHHFASMENYPNPDYKIKYVRPALVVVGILGLILIQPDTGGMAINGIIALVMFLASSSTWKRSSLILTSIVILVMLGLPLGSSWLVDHAGNSYRVARFVAYLNPFGTKNGAGSQLVNSYYAISNGGLTGGGLGNSIQKMGYLPEPNTDFILAVIAEELGFVMVVIILGLIAVIVCRSIYLGAKTNHVYEGLLCYGVATFFCIETVFNIGGVSGLLPITGVTLPFISYGGSSMVVLSASLGLVLKVSRRIKEREIQWKGATMNF